MCKINCADKGLACLRDTTLYLFSVPEATRDYSSTLTALVPNVQVRQSQSIRSALYSDRKAFVEQGLVYILLIDPDIGEVAVVLV